MGGGGLAGGDAGAARCRTRSPLMGTRKLKTRPRRSGTTSTRASDRVLMASSLVRKSLNVPADQKGVLAECERLLARWIRAQARARSRRRASPIAVARPVSTGPAAPGSGSRNTSPPRSRM